MNILFIVYNRCTCPLLKANKFNGYMCVFAMWPYDDAESYASSDAIYLYVIENKQISSRPMLISIGIDKNGYRQVQGLVNSLEKQFSGTPHQRCMVHFMRNFLSKVLTKKGKH